MYGYNILSDIQKNWLKSEIIDLAKNHEKSAITEHVWALGSYTNKDAIMHEHNADSHREYALFLRNIVKELGSD